MGVLKEAVRFRNPFAKIDQTGQSANPIAYFKRLYILCAALYAKPLAVVTRLGRAQTKERP